jgi:hypothetical protein
MRSAVLPAGLVLAGLTIWFPAFGADLPQHKAGLWQVTTTSPAGDMPSRQVQMCIDPATDAAMTRLGMSMSQGVCSKTDVKRDGDTITAGSVCKNGQTQTSSRAVTHLFGDSAYHTDINFTFDPPLMGRASSVLAQDAKWLGACPADMKPGDLVMANGMKVNIRTLMTEPKPKQP